MKRKRKRKGAFMFEIFSLISLAGSLIFSLSPLLSFEVNIP